MTDEHELVTMIRDGLPYEEAVAYCDRCIASGHRIIDRLQRAIDSYTDIRGTILRFMEEDKQKENK